MGKGSYGVVFKAVHKASQIERAIKIIYKKKVDDMVQIFSEIESLRTVDHPNIVKLYEHYETMKEVFLVQELLKGE